MVNVGYAIIVFISGEGILQLEEALDSIGKQATTGPEDVAVRVIENEKVHGNSESGKDSLVKVEDSLDIARTRETRLDLVMERLPVLALYLRGELEEGDDLKTILPELADAGVGVGLMEAIPKVATALAQSRARRLTLVLARESLRRSKTRFKEAYDNMSTVGVLLVRAKHRLGLTLTDDEQRLFGLVTRDRDFYLDTDGSCSQMGCILGSWRIKRAELRHWEQKLYIQVLSLVADEVSDSR